MKTPFVLVLVAMLAVLIITHASQDPTRSGSLVLTHVTVIDATGAAASPDVTVVITGDRINEIGPPDSIRLPKEALVVDATGKYLIPGLWDMHVHWYLKDYLPLFIANGVTGIRLMWGMPIHQAWRNEMAKGRLIGPRLVIASPIIDGPKPIWRGSMAVADSVSARTAVREVKRDGADFVKVYSLLPRNAYLAIADEAKKQGLPFAGHVPHWVSVAEASDAGQKSIEHLTGILSACSDREEQVRKGLEDAYSNLAENQRFPSRARTNPLTRLMVESFNSKKAAALFDRLKRNQTWQCPTITVLRSTAFIDDPKLRSDPRLKYMPAQIRTSWDPATDSRFRQRTAEDFELARVVFKKNLELIGMMRRAGVEFIAGTDTLNPYCFPGFSLHNELDLLVQAGLTPMEALQAATFNPARFLGKEKELGTVERGKIADLVLLEANPLQDINNTKRINAVVMGGRLITKAELGEMLAKIEAAANQN
jgi:imidazolonepropionase-like amidohydrolase